MWLGIAVFLEALMTVDDERSPLLTNPNHAIVGFYAVLDGQVAQVINLIVTPIDIVLAPVFM